MEIDGQVIALIIFVVIGAIQWLIKKVQDQGGAHDTADSLEDIYEDFREEIQQRQTTILHPPPPLPADIPESYPAQTINTEPQETPQLAKAETAKLTDEQKEAAERFAQLGKGKGRKRNTKSTARALLSDPQSARQAVILQEIFAKPKSMQKF